MSRAAASSALFKQLRTYEVLQSARSGRNSSTHEGYRLLHQPRYISFCQARVNHAYSTLLNPRTMEKSMLSAQHYVCSFTSSSALLASERAQQESARKDIAAQDEDPFDPLTDKIPERPVTFAEGASYSIAIFVGFAIAGAAAYAVFKELVFEPKEYKIFGKALERVQSDNQVTVRLGTPITGYGQQSRNRAARQRIPNRVWTDEDGVERVEVQFFIRGPHGAGKVHSEMFKDKIDKKWKFTYLLVDVLAPSPIRLMLESYVPS